MLATAFPSPARAQPTDPAAESAESSARQRLPREPAAGLSLAPAELYRVEPRRTEQPPRLDGRLDEEAWRSAAVIDTFVQQEPSEGDPATEATVVRLLYDARALYIGVEAFDSRPEAVIATEMRRDSPRLLDEDNFQIILDTFHDRRSGYMFVISPLGAKLEQQVAEEGEGGFPRQQQPEHQRELGRRLGRPWPAARPRAGSRRSPSRWSPCASPPPSSQIWGANFMRNIRRKNEQIFWAPISKEYTLTRVSQAGTLTGITVRSTGAWTCG